MPICGFFSSFSVGAGNGLAIVETGEIYAWGPQFPDIGTPVRLGTAGNWVSVASVGDNFSGYRDRDLAAINAAGELYAWGYNRYGQLGDGTNGISTNKNRPTRIGTASNWVKLVSEGNYYPYHCLVVNADGQLYSWGSNRGGPLGYGSNAWISEKSSPSKIGTASNWSQVVAGRNHNLAINTEGEIYAWGWNRNG